MASRQQAGLRAESGSEQGIGKSLSDDVGDEIDEFLEDEEEEEGGEEEEEEEEEEDPNRVQTFTEESIKNLVTNLEGKCMMLAMYLNIPTTTLVYMGLNAQTQNMNKLSLHKDILMYWVALRATKSDRAKAKELMRALRACELDEVAESVMPTLESKEMFKSENELREEKRRLEDEEEEEEDDDD